MEFALCLLCSLKLECISSMALLGMKCNLEELLLTLGDLREARYGQQEPRETKNLKKGSQNGSEDFITIGHKKK